MSKNITELLSFDNEVFKSYMFWSAVLALKMFFMVILTGLQRFTTHISQNYGISKQIVDQITNGKRTTSVQYSLRNGKDLFSSESNQKSEPENMSVAELLTFDNAVFKTYVFWSAVLAIKMLLMSGLTAMQRFKTKTFANPEDLLSKKDKVKFDDPNVERVRRAHRNDMENILPFFIVGLLYVLTNPAAFLAINLFRAVAIARIVHTLVYAVVVVPQPARALAFFVALLATAYMAVRVVIFAL